MRKLTRKELANNRKGKMGKGWGKKYNSKPSPHIFHTDRWVVASPNGVKMAYLSEERATEVAVGIANRLNSGIEVDHQVLKDGEWISTEE